MRPYMNPTCHNHCTDISPVRDNRMPLQGSFCVNFLGTIIALTFPPVRDNRMPPQGSSLVNFVVTIVALISPLWETIV